MSDKHLSVLKVLLYVFDVGSDWTNGAFMIQEAGSSFNISCLEDHEQEEMHKFFGYMVGYTWIIGNDFGNACENYSFGMVMKLVEGIVEAGPQLILQLHIIAIRGIGWKLGGTFSILYHPIKTL